MKSEDPYKNLHARKSKRHISDETLSKEQSSFIMMTPVHAENKSIAKMGSGIYPGQCLVPTIHITSSNNRTAAMNSVVAIHTAGSVLHKSIPATNINNRSSLSRNEGLAKQD